MLTLITSIKNDFHQQNTITVIIKNKETLYLIEKRGFTPEQDQRHLQGKHFYFFLYIAS